MNRPRHGFLSEYFTGVAAKALSAVEADPGKSRQHEFNGSNSLVRIFGEAGSEKCRFPATMLYLDENGEEPVVAASWVTWYDARARSAARTGRSEHRLYFPTTHVSQCASAGDTLFIARTPADTVLIIIAEAASTISAQLRWLFGLTDLAHPGFSVRAELETEQDRLGFAASVILEQLGVATDLSDETYLDEMLGRFGGGFPTTAAFSAYARETLPEVVPEDGPDRALLAWMEREEVLFRTLEKHLLGERLRQGFVRDNDPDVEGFFGYSLSVQNRRKSRAGSALENHVEIVFRRLGVRYARGVVTERGNRPDFLFPGAEEYRDTAFPGERLTMLGTKTTAKDRWRQVTKEADRIELKHLLTLEPAISEKQTDQMRESQVQLVVPYPLHHHFSIAQQGWLMSLRDFIELVARRNEAV